MSQVFAFILILLFLAIFLRVDFIFTIFYLFVGVYLVIRWWTDQILKELHVTRHFSQPIFFGDEVTITLKIKNGSRLPVPWVMFNEALPWAVSVTDSVRQVLSLGPGEVFVFKYPLVGRRRGYYQIGPLILNTGDLLGFGRQVTARTEADYLIVYPKILSLAQLGLPAHSPHPVLTTSTPIFEDVSRLNGIRAYRWGDNPRHIHWPATANTGQMAVKQFQPAIARETVIFLNMNRLEYHRQERAYSVELAIIAAASLAKHLLIEEKLPVGLDTFAFDPLHKMQHHFWLPPHKEETHLQTILQTLARLQPVDQGDFLGDLRRQAVHLSWGATIVIITGEESEALLEMLLWLKGSGFKPTLVLVGQHTTLNPLTKLTAPTFEFWREKDIETWSTLL